MSSYSEGQLVPDGQDYSKPRSLTREELMQFTFKRQDFASTTVNSYGARAPMGVQNSVHRTYGGLGGFQSSDHKAYALEGFGYDPGNSSNRWRWMDDDDARRRARMREIELEEEALKSAAAPIFQSHYDLLKKIQDQAASVEESEENTLEQWLNEVPERFREQLRTVRVSMQLPSDEDAQTMDASSAFVIWDDEPCRALFIKSQQVPGHDTGPIDTKQDDLFRDMMQAQERVMKFFNSYHDRLAKIRVAGSLPAARAAARNLDLIVKKETQLRIPGPKIISQEMQAWLEELVRAEPYVQALYGFDAYDDTQDDDESTADADQCPKPTSLPKLHLHECDICHLKEPARHYRCTMHPKGYDVCIGCFDAGQTRCPDTDHPLLQWSSECNDSPPPRLLTPDEARTIRLWIANLEQYRADTHDTVGFVVSPDNHCEDKAKFMKTFLEQTSSGSSPKACETKLHHKLDSMISAREGAKFLITNCLASVHDDGAWHEGFDGVECGKAAHELLLWMLALESSFGQVEKPPWAVSDTVRHSLLWIASLDETAEDFWARLLGKDWFLEGVVEMGLDPEDYEDYEDGEQIDSNEGRDVAKVQEDTERLDKFDTDLDIHKN